MKESIEIKSAFIRIKEYILDLAIDAFVIILLVVIVRFFLISPFQVNGASMNSTFFHGDYIFVEKLSYTFGEPKFGDIVIFVPPKKSTAYRVRYVSGAKCIIAHLNKLSLSSDVCIDNPDFFIKRIIGIEGDVIKIENGVVYRNGEILEEKNYLNKDNNGKTFLPSFQEENEFIVPKGTVFVLGDNRNGSSDSRYWKDENNENTSFINISNIEGKYFFRLFSPHKVLN